MQARLGRYHIHGSRLAICMQVVQKYTHNQVITTSFNFSWNFHKKFPQHYTIFKVCFQPTSQMKGLAC